MNNEYYCGLNNHGNTCFFNSAIQSLMRCSVFINFISNLNIDHELIKIFKKFIIEYKEHSNSVISPIELVKYYTQINKNYRIGSQDDSDEVITLIIGKIDDIIRDEIKENRIKNVTIKGDITLDKMIDYLFGIKIRTTIKCLTCNNNSIKDTTEFKLSVGINRGSTNINLNDLLLNISKIEEMKENNQYYCSKCKINVDAFRVDNIIKTPKYFYIHLKRFENRLSKIVDPIKIHTKLNINESKYQLRGYVHHMGSYNGGHYIYNYNKEKNDMYNDWICLNDSGISNINVEREINNGFIYLYVK